MPELSRFFGIVILMYYNDHAPPHFHARYGSEKATFAIDSLRVLSGRLLPRALGLVIERATVHGDELLEDWELARLQAPLKPIKPLE